MTAETLSGNGPMLGLAARAGYTIALSPGDDGVVHLQKSLLACSTDSEGVAAAQADAHPSHKPQIQI
jgi:hypothetical protein